MFVRHLKVGTWLHASLLLCMLREAASEPRLSHNIFDIERVELASLLPGCSLRYEVLLFQAELGGTVRRSVLPTTDGAAAPRLDAESFHGLMELDCGPCSWESPAPMRARPPHAPPTGIVDLTQAGDSAVAAFLASSLLPDFSSIQSATAVSGLGGMVILSSSASEACNAMAADASPDVEQLQRSAQASWNYTDACFSTNVKDIESASSCSLKLLSQSEQVHRRHPARIMVSQGGKIRNISGNTLALQLNSGWFSTSRRSQPEDVVSHRQAPEKARLLEALRLGRSVLRSALPTVYAMEDRPYSLLQSQSLVHPPDNKVDLELLEELSSGRSRSEIRGQIHAELGADVTAAAVGGAALEATIPGLANMLNPIMDGLLKPVVGLVAGTLADVVGDSVGKLLAGTVDSGLTSEIESNLGHSLTTSLTESLVPPLTESLSDSITNTLGPMLRDSVSSAVSTQLIARLTDSLADTLAATVASQLEADVPEELSEDLSNDLIHFLTQSVTQAVVPALTYALHHSPAEDYFCAYCKEFNTYCMYCRKDGPEQLYRAQYYAAYYSKYYAAMYSKQGDKTPRII
jgi:hypothetical protein